MEPLYTMEDAERTLPLPTAGGLSRAEAGRRSSPTRHTTPGTCWVVVVTLEIEGERVIFSGDVGRPKLPISAIREALPPADYLIMESTYGDRLHKDEGLVADRLADVIATAPRRAEGRSSCRRSRWAARSNWSWFCISWPIRTAFLGFRYSSIAHWR